MSQIRIPQFFITGTSLGTSSPLSILNNEFIVRNEQEKPTQNSSDLRDHYTYQILESKSSLDDLFEHSEKKRERIRLPRPHYTGRKQTPIHLAFDPNESPEQVSFQRKFIDTIYKQNPAQRWNVSLSLSKQSILFLAWGHLADQSLQYKLTSHSENSLFVLRNDQWIPIEKNSFVLIKPGEHIKIETDGDSLELELPDPIDLRQKMNKVILAYEFFDIDLNCDKKTAQSAYRKALHQSHPDKTQHTSNGLFSSVMENWNLIKWYNGW